MFSFLTVAAFLLTPPGTPAGGFHWQRIITPPPGANTQQACVVLDAATFANAAPALRDLRLFQDGTELPYVIEESYDERALNSGVTTEDDRSEYEPVAIAALQPVRESASGDPPGITAPFVWIGHLRLPAHVPVERLRLEPATLNPTQVDVVASAAGDRSGPAERASGTLMPEHSVWPLTLGANLQHDVNVDITESQSSPGPQRVMLEMRRRSLCYQPRSGSPLVLYLGGGQGIAAKVYGLSDGFSTDQQRPYATMGPLEPNPDLQHAAKKPISRLLIGVGVLAGTLLLTLWIGLEILRKEKGRPKTAHPA